MATTLSERQRELIIMRAAAVPQSVRAQLRSLLDAGATDIWAQPVAVGPDKAARADSRRRTIDTLRELLDNS
jgi:hypothetical protein